MSRSLTRARTAPLLGSALVGAALVLSGCSVTRDATTEDGGSASAKRTVVLATHDSWAVPKKVLADFTRQTGYTVQVRRNGDAGALTNRLVLTKGSPIADVAYGIDTTFASRAVDEGVLAPYASPDRAASAASYALTDEEQAAALTPIDYGDVCVNVDDRWFAERGKRPPRTLDDLTDPAYRDLFVTPGASSSSPGLAFLLATIADRGDRWPAYWERLMANGAKVTAGWSDAYEVDFSARGGDRPIVLSYASSPPFTIPKGERRPTTSALLDTCFRQVEYAGVLAGAENPAGAEALIDFMSGPEFQRALPESMYVFPVDDRAPLPAAWARFARTPKRPATVPPKEIAANRDAWLREWTDIVSR